jgi:O-antigen ligase
MAREERADGNSARSSRSLLGVFSAVTIAAALIVGGGTRSGLGTDAVIQLASLPLLVLVALNLSRIRLGWLSLWPVAVVAGALSLPIAQLVPLPANFWAELPGREIIAASYEQTATPIPPLPISLDFEATRLAALSLLPAVAVFLGTLLLDLQTRRKLTVVIASIALVNVLVGLAQIQLGHANVFNLYSGTGLGLFANRNHFAALFYITIPFAAAWVVGVIVDRRPAAVLRAVIFSLLYAVLLLGLGMARSRSGLVLGVFAGAGSLALAWASSERAEAKRPGPLITAAISLGVFLIMNFALLGIVERLETDVSEDYRFEIATHSSQAARAFFPLGSGFGTFIPVYRMFEPVSAFKTVYANHAHNDWLELLVEGGLPAAILAGAGVLWLAVAVVRLWRLAPRDRGALDLAMQRAASIAILLLLLHSIVDYPLRTTAIMVVFSFCCGLLIAPMSRYQPTGAEKRRSSGEALRPE